MVASRLIDPLNAFAKYVLIKNISSYSYRLPMSATPFPDNPAALNIWGANTLKV